MAEFKPVSHVIFDLDGLLLDTENLYMQARVKLCSQFHKEYTLDMHMHITGFLGMEACVYIVSELELPISAEEFYNRAKELLQKLFPSATLKPDTEPIYFKAQSTILSRYGKEYTKELRYKILGTIELDTGRIFVEELNLPITAEEYMTLQTNEIATEMPNARLMPGAERIIRHFHACGVPIAVATSSSRHHVDLKFTNHKELFSLMHHLVSGTSDEEVKKGKPAPDIFLICASKFPDNPPPEKVLVFEDAPNGVLAARAAGMQVVMVPEEHVPEEKRSKATLVLSSLENFQPELFGLPPFKCCKSNLF